MTDIEDIVNQTVDTMEIINEAYKFQSSEVRRPLFDLVEYFPDSNKDILVSTFNSSGKIPEVIIENINIIFVNSFADFIF